MKAIYFLFLTFFVCHVSVANGISAYSNCIVTDPTMPTLSSLAVCDDNNDGFSVFDLTVQNALILAAQSSAASNYSVYYYETTADATAGGNAISNLNAYNNIQPNSQTIYVRVRNINTNAFVVGQFQIVVNSRPFPVSPSDYNLCDFSGAVGYEAFDLDILIQQILGGSSSTLNSVTFYTSQANAEAGINMITNPTSYVNQVIWTQTLYARVTTIATGCYGVVFFNIVVNVRPFLDLDSALQISTCDNDLNTQDGVASIDLTQVISYFLSIQPLSASNYTFSFYTTQPNANAGVSPIIPANNYTASNGQNVWARIENNVSGCYAVTPFSISISAPLALITPPPLGVCDDDANPNDQYHVFDLTVRNNAITQGLTGYTVTYYSSLLNAQNNTNPITNPTAYVNVNLAAQTLGVVVTSSEGCKSITTLDIRVEPTPNPILVSNNTLNTVYVDGSNNVVQPLLLDSGLNGNYSYEWQVDGALIVNAVNSTYLVDTASLNSASRVFAVTVQDLDTGCSSSNSIIVDQSSGVPSPNGAISQTFNPGDTLANITVVGQNILWYSSVANRNVTSSPLPLNTPLVDGMTYYATQTIGGIESVARLPVTVHLALGLPNNEILSLHYAPNPVKDVLSLESNSILKSVLVYNLLGQKVYEKSFNDTHVLIDLSNLHAGNYIAKVEGETAQKVIKILKQ